MLLARNSTTIRRISKARLQTAVPMRSISSRIDDAGYNDRCCPWALVVCRLHGHLDRCERVVVAFARNQPTLLIMGEADQNRSLILCGGPQGSGSSLISWCFLQRQDMDGVFDTAHDMVPSISSLSRSDYTWCKITTCCFSTRELIDYFRGLGWEVRPLLVLRDVREVWASLRDKQYGRNGTTAEDPPLRLRLQRFLADWHQSVAEGWATIQYDRLIHAPRETLQQTCTALNLPWDEGMIDWPKEDVDISDSRYGNVNFLRSRQGGLLETINPANSGRIAGTIAPQDLEWLETTFRDFNTSLGYPTKRDVATSNIPIETASFAATRRSEWKQQRTSNEKTMANILPQSLIQRLGLR